MLPFNIVTVLINGLTLALALGFLVIVLWHDARKQVNQFFAIYLFLITLWNVGSLLSQSVLLVDHDSPIVDLALSIMEVGFTGSSVAIYVLTATLVGANSRQFRWLAFGSLLFIVVYRVFLIVTSPPVVASQELNISAYQFQPLSLVFYLAFDGITFYLVWHHRKKIRSNGLIVGIILSLLGQSMGFLNPQLSVVVLSTNISSIGALLISFAILRQEIITPLEERVSQVDAMHKVSLAIWLVIAKLTLCIA